MKTQTLTLVLLITLMSYCCQEDKKNQNPVAVNTIEVEAPFGIVNIIVPDFSSSKEYPITQYGAVEGNKEKISEAINLAIDEAHKNGGGKVIIPEGEWLTKKVHLKSNVNLHLNKNAVLLFSEDPKDYLPPVQSTWEGMECYNYSPLIYAFEAENIAITGEGQLRAKMDVWQEWFARPKAHMESLKRLYHLAAQNVPVEERQMANDSANFRPQFIQFNRCNNILIDGISIRNSPFWVIHPFLSKNIVIRDIDVYAHGHNNDGVDPEMSQNILIENCTFDQGDDAIALKAGRNQDAWRLDTPTKNVIIRNCLVKNGHQLLAIGSELSGGIENIYIENCRVEDGAKLNHLLFIKTNERRGGYVKNIFLKNIRAGKIDQGIMGVETDVLYQWRDLVPTYERKLTSIENIYLEDVKASEVKFISRIIGNKELPVKGVFMKNITSNIISDQKHIHKNIQNFKSEDGAAGN
jgi:polygalacturonase